MTQEMQAPERVHVAPQGFERDRIVEPARRLKADSLVLLNWGGGAQPDFFENVIEDLEESGIDTDVRSCEIYDMYEVIRVVTTVVQEHKDDQVYVNISTGTKISAIGGMIACMVTDAVPYYVRPESHGDSTDADPTPVSHGVEEIVELPAYPIDGPDHQHVWILEYLYRHGPCSKKALIQAGKGDGKELAIGDTEFPLPFLADSKADSRKSEYRLLDSRILEPLSEKGFIELEEVGRRTDVDLTPEGENVVTAFSHLLQDETED